MLLMKRRQARRNQFPPEPQRFLVFLRETYEVRAEVRAVSPSEARKLAEWGSGKHGEERLVKVCAVEVIPLER